LTCLPKPYVPPPPPVFPDIPITPQKAATKPATACWSSDFLSTTCWSWLIIPAALVAVGLVAFVIRRQYKKRQALLRNQGQASDAPERVAGAKSDHTEMTATKPRTPWVPFSFHRWTPFHDMAPTSSDSNTEIVEVLDDSQRS